MVERMLWNPLERMLWGVAITFLLITGLQYFRKGRQRGELNEKIMMYGWASFILCYALNFLFICLRDFLYPGVFRNGIFYVNFPLQISQSQLNLVELFAHCANLSIRVAYVLFFLSFDYVAKRTKYITSLIGFVRIVFYIIFAIFLNRLDLFFIFGPILFIDEALNYLFMFSLFLSLYFVTKWSRVEFKSVASLFFLSWIILTFSPFDTLIVPDFTLEFMFLKPVLIIIVAIINLIPIIVKPTILEAALNYWKIVGILVISITILKTLYYISIGFYDSSLSTYIGIIYGTLSNGLVTLLIIINIYSETRLQNESSNFNDLLFNRRFWKGIGLLLICLYTMMYILSLILEITIDYLAIIYNPLYQLFIIYLIIRNIKVGINLRGKEEIKEKHINILGALVRPQNLTEEEVTISQERKICLVCKGEVSKYNYICPECKTFYCMKCIDTLVDMENVCWVCNMVIDESKPIKAFEKYETEVQVEEKDRKMN